MINIMMGVILNKSHKILKPNFLKYKKGKIKDAINEKGRAKKIHQ